MLYRYSLFTLVLVLSSCAGMEESYRNEVCHREKGYEQGMNDGLEGKPMNSGFASVCDPDTRREVSRGYREGYEAALKSSESGGDNIVVKVPGIDIRVGQGKEKSWVCEVSAFGTTFSGFGPTRGQAAQDARNKCSGNHNAMHCADTECRQDK